MDKLTREEILHVAELARIKLTEEEIEPKKNEVEEKIKEINPLEMTPMEALNFLYDLKKHIKEKK